MKQTLLILTLFIALCTSAQTGTKITAMPTHTGSVDSAWVPIVIGGVNKKTQAYNVNKHRIDSLVAAVGAGISTWGSIGGDINDQADLISILNGKLGGDLADNVDINMNSHYVSFNTGASGEQFYMEPHNFNWLVNDPATSRSGSVYSTMTGSGSGANVFSGFSAYRGANGIGVEAYADNAQSLLNFDLSNGSVIKFDASGGTFDVKFNGLRTGTATKQFYWDSATQRMLIGNIPAAGAATWGSITGTLSSQSDLNTALSAKESTANKSTSTSLGTSNTLYPTQNAVKVYADTKAPLSHTHTESDVTNLVTDLAAKAPTSRTITIYNAETPTQDLSANRTFYPKSIFQQAIEALGSEVKGQSVGVNMDQMSTTSFTAVSGTVYWTAVWLPSPQTLTGIKYWLGTQGNFTGDAFNGFALYTYSGGTLTQVATSANDETIWKGTSGTYQSVPFTSTYSASAGLYFVAFLFHSSATTTAPTFGISASVATGGMQSGDFTNNAKLNSTHTSQTTLPSSRLMSALTVTTLRPWVGLY